MTDRVVVMYAGKVVEEAPTEELFAHPRHPYTLGLLSSVPRLDERRQTELRTIEGAPPDLSQPPPGCPFMPRCFFARNICRSIPPLDPLPGNSMHRKACWPDIADPREQAYAERRQQARIEAQKAAIRALKDLAKYTGRAKPEWVKIRAARKRKTFVLCRTCHQDVYAGRPLRRQRSSS